MGADGVKRGRAGTHPLPDMPLIIVPSINRLDNKYSERSITCPRYQTAKRRNGERARQKGAMVQGEGKRAKGGVQGEGKRAKGGVQGEGDGGGDAELLGAALVAETGNHKSNGV